MVVADGPMVKYHGDNLKQYILTLMNIVREGKCNKIKLSYKKRPISIGIVDLSRQKFGKLCANVGGETDHS